jgi:hypothetical protein
VKRPDSPFLARVSVNPSAVTAFVSRLPSGARRVGLLYGWVEEGREGEREGGRNVGHVAAVLEVDEEWQVHGCVERGREGGKRGGRGEGIGVDASRALASPHSCRVSNLLKVPVSSTLTSVLLPSALPLSSPSSPFLPQPLRLSRRPGPVPTPPSFPPPFLPPFLASFLLSTPQPHLSTRLARCRRLWVGSYWLDRGQARREGGREGGREGRREGRRG